MASGGSFRYKVLVGMRHVPRHAQNASTVQTILSPACADVEVILPRDMPVDDGCEFFIVAWCMHPCFIPNKKIIFIPEPRIHNPVEAIQAELPSLCYLVQLRLAAF